MKNIIGCSDEELITVKETAHILRLSPKTVYNKLSRGEFPLHPFRLPWNNRDLFFLRREVIALANIRADPSRCRLHTLLAFIPEPAEPILVGVANSAMELPKTPRTSLVTFEQLQPSEVSDWREKYDLLFSQRRNPILYMSGSEEEYFTAAAFICGLIAENLRKGKE